MNEKSHISMEKKGKSLIVWISKIRRRMGVFFLSFPLSIENGKEIQIRFAFSFCLWRHLGDF